MTDVLIAGGGPAGLTAAIYARRAGFSAAVLEELFAGGQMSSTPEIANYPGVPDASGLELAQTMERQAKALGAEITGTGITGFNLSPGALSVQTASGKIDAKTIILAMGTSRRKLNISGEEKLLGRGVSYCAVCDGNFFRNKSVVVVGGGNTALEDALYLADICPEVTLVHRRESFRAQPYLEAKVRENSKIKLALGYLPSEINGEAKVEAITLKHAQTNSEKTIDTAAVFIAVGTIPRTELLSGRINLDDGGYIPSSEDTKTEIAGVFAAGDIRRKMLRQIVTATADGAVAATMAAGFIRGDG